VPCAPISFAALKRPSAIPEWWHGYLEQPEPAPVPETFMPPAPAGLSRMFGGGKYHQQALAAGQTAYAQAAHEHRQREEQRLAALSRAQADWQAAADAAKRRGRKAAMRRSTRSRLTTAAVILMRSLPTARWCWKHPSTQRASRRNSRSRMAGVPAACHRIRAAGRAGRACGEGLLLSGAWTKATSWVRPT
jgi:hypothetical protein